MHKVLKFILYPPIYIKIILVVISSILLIYSLTLCDYNSVTSIISYIIAFYTLMIVILDSKKIVYSIINNKMILILKSNVKIRIIISLIISCFFNLIYVVLHIILGFMYQSFWFIILAIYYSILIVLRLILLFFIIKERNDKGVKLYGFYGLLLLIINILLIIIMTYLINLNKTYDYHKIVVIALATYTFTSIISSIISIIKYKKYNNYVYSASKNISFISSCISIITLESIMLNVFGENVSNDYNKIMLGFTGALVYIIILFIALKMIITSRKERSRIKNDG